MNHSANPSIHTMTSIKKENLQSYFGLDFWECFCGSKPPTESRSVLSFVKFCWEAAGACSSCLGPLTAPTWLAPLKANSAAAAAVFSAASFKWCDSDSVIYRWSRESVYNISSIVIYDFMIYNFKNLCYFKQPQMWKSSEQVCHPGSRSSSPLPQLGLGSFRVVYYDRHDGMYLLQIKSIWIQHDSC